MDAEVNLFISNASLDNFASHIATWIFSGKIGIGDLTPDSSLSSAHLDSPVRTFGAIHPGLEEKFVFSWADHDISQNELALVNFFATATGDELSRGDSTAFGVLPGIPYLSAASLNISILKFAGIIGNTGFDPLHGSVDSLLTIDACNTQANQERYEKNSFHSVIMEIFI